MEGIRYGIGKKCVDFDFRFGISVSTRKSAEF
jgi:hypothetical protein